ncbi:MAG: GLPGLI family protein [Ferruginibacter sp.]|nr:GLPGLI family protein [Chitinophagaceae bacterium]
MKKIFIAGCTLLSVSLVQGQLKEGKVTYERTLQMQIRINDMPGGMESQLPRTRTNKFELTFGNNQSLWKAAEQENDNDNVVSGDGMQIRMIVPGTDDVLYTNFTTGTSVEERDVMDKKFIIDDSIRPLKWKMTGETKTILNMPAMKATATNISTRMTMNMDNGKMERKEVQDTANITAWFTSNIPVSAGPAEYQGQLPGLILEMDVNNGRQVFKATSITEKADLAVIKQPTGKKHYTPAEFRKEREKMMEEMQKNNQGGNRVIRMN